MVKNGHSITGYSRVGDVNKMDMAVLASGKETIEDTSRELTPLPEPKEDADVFGEPEVTPRVGEEYQVSLPELVSRSEYEEQLTSEVKERYVKSAESGPDNHEHDQVDSEGKDSSAVNEKSSNTSGSFPVPCSLYEPLSKTEEEIFLLGLYIFGRDFARVKRFVGSRNIGEILSYYYGKFYKSQRYKRWIGCKKLRGRRCGCGQKLFIGLRQQELQSRLLPQLSEEGKNKLIEVSKTFSWGNVLLEEYVTTLKDIVGLENLVKAVGIGEGKQDLTRMPLDKLSRAAHLHPACPPKEACATFSREEILNFLQGRGRLSKAQSNDLFWDAVWPRLLAKGWHSEQPTNSLFSKECFVFLVPGVTKFSRRKLVKGHHYFDCVRDVLTKVASDPSILDLEGESGEGHTVEEMNRDLESSPDQGEGYMGEEMNLDREKSPNQDQRCYLKPRTKSQDLKFTVVDTTVGNGETRRLREVRDLHVEVNSAVPGSHLVEDERNSVKVERIARDPAGESNYLSFNMVEADMFNPVNVISFDKKETPANDKSVDTSLNRDDDGKGTTQCRQKPRKKPDEKNSLAPEPRKRRKMKISSDKQMGGCTEVVGEPMKPELEKEETNCCPATNIPENKNSVAVGENETDHKPRRMLSFDLNLMPEPETTEPENVEMPMEQHNQASQLVGVTAAPSADRDPTISEMQPSGNSRRQSGRTRLMSTKALEALASGLMVRETKRKQR